VIYIRGISGRSNPTYSGAPRNFAPGHPLDIRELMRQGSRKEDTMAQRRQRGWLKKEKRVQGETWVLYFRTRRKSDGRRVENKIAIGLVRDLPNKSTAWAEVERLHLQINPVDLRRGVAFADLALHYAEHELVGRSESIHPKAHTTIKGYERVLRNRLLPRWGTRIALGIEPGSRGLADDVEEGRRA
jgi:hypothetical protein